MDIQDLKVTYDKGDRYQLVVVDRASKVFTAFPLPSKEATGVSRKLLQLLLIFGLPLSIRCDPGSESATELRRHHHLRGTGSIRAATRTVPSRPG